MERNQQTLQSRLGNGVSAVDVNNNIVLACQQNPKLLECSTGSLLQCAVQAVSYGLSLGGAIKHVSIVPYGQTATLVVEYKGFLELARRHRLVENVVVEHVFEGDDYEYLGLMKLPHHRPSNHAERRMQPLTHAYVVVYFSNGRVFCRSWTKAEVIAHRNQFSQNWKRHQKPDNPWHEDNPSFCVMAGKTVLRYMVNRGEIPLAKEYASMITDEALDGNVVESRTLDEPPQLPDLSDMMAEESQIEAVEQTEASWKEIYRNALSNQKSMSGVKEVYNAIREISDADPDDAIWAEQMMKARLVEIGK